jgi:cellulose synthase/poly-beta-1,6-N-acetylglucosamine synthase-like glycosyltransferase
MIIEIILLILFFLLIYPFVIYPLLLWIFSKLFRKTIKQDVSYKPEVTFILSVYNEEELVSEAIESVFNCGYPNELIHLIIGSDGSTDNTSNIIEELMHKHKNISFYEFPRSGKNYVLNQIIPKSNTEIILFIDADSRIIPNSLELYLSKYYDENVGSSLAAIEIINDENNTGSFGETLYHKFESNIRRWESAIKTNTNTLSALFGIKKELYKPIPNDLVCDDLFHILSISLQNKRVIYDEDTKVIEVRRKTLKGELRRRVRFVAGGLSTLWNLKKEIIKDFGWTSFFILSHKLIRYLSPFFLIGIFISTILLTSNSKLFPYFAIGQLVLYSSTLIGWVFEKMKINFILFKIPLFFISINIGFLLGIFKFLLATPNSAWDKVIKSDKIF